MCEKCIKICNAIAELTKAEGDSLTIHADNPEFFGANKLVETDSLFHGKSPARYEGENLLECLEFAVADKLGGEGNEI